MVPIAPITYRIKMRREYVCAWRCVRRAGEPRTPVGRTAAHAPKNATLKALNRILYNIFSLPFCSRFFSRSFHRSPFSYPMKNDRNVTCTSSNIEHNSNSRRFAFARGKQSASIGRASERKALYTMESIPHRYKRDSLNDVNIKSSSNSSPDSLSKSIDYRPKVPWRRADRLNKFKRRN